MNLIITDVCNRSCPYCFASQKVKLGDNDSDKQRGYISLENVNTYLDFLENSNVSELKLLGGEPTLHPEFNNIISLGVERGFFVTVFSNAIWNDNVLNFVSNNYGPEQIGFVLNINEPQYQSAEEKQRQQKCFEAVGNSARVGFNIYNEDFDIQFIADIIVQYSLKKSVRLGLAHPIFGTNNDFPDI